MKKIGIVIFSSVIICYSCLLSFADNKNIVVQYDNDLFTIDAKDVPIADVIYVIYKKTGIDFLYSKNTLNNKITFETTNTPVRKTIKNLLKTCKIKNYSINVNKDKTIKSVEIFSNLKSSTSSSSSSRIDENLPFPFEEEEDFIENDGEPIITHREYDITEDSEDSDIEYRPPFIESEEEEEENEEEETKGTFRRRSSSKRTSSSTTEDKDTDDSHIYRPPGSSTRKQIEIKDTIEDMSDSYHPPGYVPGETSTTNKYSESDELEDMSHEYRPPGS